MQKPVLIVSGRAADRLARLPARGGVVTPAAEGHRSYQVLLEESRSTVPTSVLPHAFGIAASAHADAVGTTGTAVDGSSLNADTDPSAQVVVTPETLVQLRVIHGSWVEVGRPGLTASFLDPLSCPLSFSAKHPPPVTSMPSVFHI
jgi:hypothetical protein